MAVNLPKKKNKRRLSHVNASNSYSGQVQRFATQQISTAHYLTSLLVLFLVIILFLYV